MRPAPNRRRRNARRIRERDGCSHVTGGMGHQVVDAKTDAAGSVLLVRWASGGWHQVIHSDDVLDCHGKTFLPLFE